MSAETKRNSRNRLTIFSEVEQAFDHIGSLFKAEFCEILQFFIMTGEL